MKNSNNWCKLPYEVIADERLSHTSMIIYAIMLDKSKGGESKITYEKLSGLTNLSLSTIKRAIQQLKATGYITSVRTENGRTTFYTLKSVIEVRERPAESEQPRQVNVKPAPQDSGTLKTDLTPEEIDSLIALYMTKIVYGGEERAMKLLESDYLNMRLSAKNHVRNQYAYLKSTINNRKPEGQEQEEPEKNDYDMSKYDFVINNV
ncbi:MAG: helix-turn-helix domain-containing protein [Ruminococcus sp.]|nr:helix-turn-helix domain-containing protein [Ruminococcus sp.]